jgi:hypothetical protein
MHFISTSVKSSQQKVYKLLCFILDPSEDMCQEKKALYKLISGLHSSISVHIAYDYLLDESTNLVLVCYCSSVFSLLNQIFIIVLTISGVNGHSGDIIFLCCMIVF